MVGIVKVAGSNWPLSQGYDDVAARVISDINSWINFNQTLNITFNYVTDGSVAGSFCSTSFNAPTTYAGVKSLLTGLTTDQVKNSAYATLPGSDPNSGHAYAINYIHYATLNNSTPETSFVHNQVDIGNGVTWDLTVDGSTCLGGHVGLYQAVMHEVTEVLGRTSKLNSNTSILDLFSYTSANTRSFTLSNARYFSWDGGTTNSGNYDHGGSNDAGDWVSTTSPFNGTAVVGDPQHILTTDVQLLMALGYPMSTAGIVKAGLNPYNLTVPTIAGNSIVSQTLTATGGTWSGSSSVAFQWRADDVDINGETGSTYVPVSGDVGKVIKVAETSTNTNGSTTAVSVGTAAITSTFKSFGGLALQLHR